MIRCQIRHGINVMLPGRKGFFRWPKRGRPLRVVVRHCALSKRLRRMVRVTP